jgi:hypothetical protein
MSLRGVTPDHAGYWFATAFMDRIGDFAMSRHLRGRHQMMYFTSL